MAEGAYATAMLRRHDDGAFASFIEGKATLTLSTEPLGAEVSLYRYRDRHGLLVAKKMGVYKSNKRTNAFNKSDEHACSIAFTSAIISLQKRARSLGGDAVVDIVSVTKNDNLESTSDFRCNVGSFVANVALSGRVVKLK